MIMPRKLSVAALQTTHDWNQNATVARVLDLAHGADRIVELGDRTARLPAAARIVSTGAADFGNRNVDFLVKFCPGCLRAAQ